MYRILSYRLLWVLAMMTVAFSGLYAAEPSLAEADSAYNKGDYESAIKAYNAVADVQGTSAALLFNLGNAYYKEGDEGHAMVCYQRARRLDPSNNRINDNIRFLSSKVQDANKAELKGKKGNVAPDPESFFQRVGRNITSDTSANYWGAFGAMAFIILIGAIAIYLFSPSVQLKKIGFFSAIIMFFFSVIFVVFALVAADHFESREEAVLINFNATLMEEPDAGARSVGFPLHRGTLFNILEEEQGPDGKAAWYKVKLNSDNIGWIEASNVEII